MIPYPRLQALAGVLAWCVLTSAPASAQSVVYVDDDASGANDGSGWCDAFNYLQDALAAAVASGGTVTEIRVAQGAYTPDRDLANPSGTGDRYATFQLLSGVALKGGYAGCGAPDPDVRDVEVYDTALSGDLSGDDGPDFANNGENSYHVVTAVGTDGTAVLDGFTIKGGNADGVSPDDHGGGVFGGGGTPAIHNCLITTCRAEGGGGGIHDSDGEINGCTISDNTIGFGIGGGLENCDGLIAGCTISGNAARWGAGLYNCLGTISDCIISENSADVAGGGLASCSGTIAGCTITGNSSGNTGGGLYQCNGTVTGCTISGNSAGIDGGAASYCDGTIGNCVISGNSAILGGGLAYCSADVVNCTVVGNKADQGGALAECNGEKTNCIFWDNTNPFWYYSYPDPTYSCWPGPELDGNIEADPLFRVPGYWSGGQWTEGDYRLSSDSPCIDAGNNVAGESIGLTTDVRGFPRFYDDPGTEDTGNGTAPLIDMGAYEFADCNDNGIIDVDDISAGTSEDCNANAIPDECEPDCNGNANPDDCDVADGTSEDCNGNNTPDECIELEVDCNSNLVPDTCDIADGTSEDVDGNGVPDECQVILRVPSPEFPTIAAAIAGANAGDTVLVADGVHEGDASLMGKAITVRSENGPDNCIVDGGYFDVGFRFSSGETPATVIDGFTITHARGGGIRIESASPTIRNCILRHNRSGSSAYGGGVYSDGGNPIISGCVIEDNDAPFGAGFAVIRGNPTLVNTVIRNNRSVFDGAGVYCGSEATLTMTNVTLTRNQAQGEGGAIFAQDMANVVVSNSILWGDLPDEVEGQGQVALSYSDIQGGWPGEGNIDQDPLFALIRDEHLPSTSPCVDSGTNSPPVGLPPSDMDGLPRSLDGNGDSVAIADMGAYEHHPTAPILALSPPSLEFFVPNGQTEASEQIMSIRNTGGGTLNWEISEECDWLLLIPDHGDSTGGIDDVRVIVSSFGLGHGDYSCELTVAGGGATNAPRIVDVVVHVNSTLRVPADYPAIKPAVNAAVDGDTVLVADGIYTGPDNSNVRLNGKRITVRSENGPEHCHMLTDQRGFGFHAGEKSDTVIDGFKITNAGNVAAIWCTQGSSPTIRNCILTRNMASGIDSDDSSPTVIDCEVSYNHDDSRAAMHFGGLGRPTIIGCRVFGNSNGGIHLSGGTISDTLVQNNSGYGVGGISIGTVIGDPVTITNTIVRGNEGGAGGIECGAGGAKGRARITNCTVSGNVGKRAASVIVGGIFVGSDCHFDLTNNIIWGNTPGQFQVSGSLDVSFSDVEGGWPGEGNIDTDPLFAFDDDAHLMFGSPAIDAGTNNPPGGLPPTDFDGTSRPIDGNDDTVAIADMGAYENGGTVPCIAVAPLAFEFMALLDGANPVPETLRLRNCGGALLAWQASAPCAWLSIDPNSGTLAPAGTVALTLSTDKTGLDHGNHTCELAITDAQAVNSPQSIDLAFRLGRTFRVPSENPTIQEAIDATTVVGDVVLVADGTYAGPGNTDIEFDSKIITVRSENGFPNCIIDGQGQNWAFNIQGAETQFTVLDGFTITNGFSHGIVIQQGASSITVSNCWLRQCGLAYAGGAIWCAGRSPRIINCIFSDNAARKGGAIYVSANELLVLNSTFWRNSAEEPGGAILSRGETTVQNSVFWENSPDDVSPDWIGEINVRYSLGSGFDGPGNINSDPLFVDPNGGDFQLGASSPAIDAGDNTSVFADVGDQDADGDRTEVWPLDMDRSFRFIDDPATTDTGNGTPPIVDMGAYEFQVCGNGVVDPGEECDDGLDNSDTEPDACRTDCRQAWCGDDVVDTGELCDGGGESATCDSDCTFTECGDGTVNLTGGEQCDDGNSNDGDGCTSMCIVEFCGDGTLNDDGQEECDGGQGDPNDCCADDCTVEPGTHECRPADDVCDAAEFCDSISADCPQDDVKPSTTRCREIAGPCDVRENCDGVHKSCPTDGYDTYGIVCRSSIAMDCDPEERCDGMSPSCPPDSITTECVHDDACCPRGCIGPDPGNDEPGNDSDCPKPVPTVSTWGLLILALLLLVAGKVSFSRRRAAVTA